MTDKEVMQMALETLDNMVKVDWREWDEFASVEDFVRWAKSRANFTAEALRTALAQPDYERGFVDGMQKQMQSSVDKAVNMMTQPEEKYYKQAVDGEIPEAYTPAKGGLLPEQKREPSGSWTSWDNTMCNPIASGKMQTQSAWQDGYDSAKAEWVGLTYNEIKDILDCGTDRLVNIKKAEAKLKEKNGY